MKIEYPLIAIVDNDSDADSKLETIIKKRVPCKIDRYNSFDKFIGSDIKDYQLILVDPYLFYRKISLPGGIEKIKGKYPESKIVAVSGIEMLSSDLKKINNRRYVTFLDKPKVGEGFLRMEEEANRILSEAIDSGSISIKTPVGVYGSGIVAVELVGALLEKDIEVYWYGKALADGKFTYPFTNQTLEKSIGYEQLMMLRDIPLLNSNLHCVQSNRTSDMFDSGLGFFVFASSLYKKLELSRDTNRSDKDFLDYLYKNVSPAHREFLEFIKNGKCDATKIIVSNPPESHAYNQMIEGNNPHKIITGCPNERRFEKLLPRGSEFVLLGEHGNLIFQPELCATHGHVLGNLKELKNELAYTLLNQKLKSWGVETMMAFAEASKEIPYKDAANAVAQGIYDVFHFKRPTSFGYYQEKFNGFLLGPPPIVDYKDLSFHEDKSFEFYGNYNRTLRRKSISKMLKDMVNAQRERASV